MYILIVVLILIISVILAFAVLIQNSKGGGLAANFSAPNQIMGVRRTTDFIEKATWYLAGLLIVLSIVATATIPTKSGEETLKTNVTVDNNINTATDLNAIPMAQDAATPAETPVQE